MPNKPAQIPFPLSSFPGLNPQESSGRLVNCYAEPLGEPQRPTGPSMQIWRGCPGLSQHAITAQAGYRGGLLVKNLSYEVFKDTAATVDAAGVVNVLGAFPGSQQVSIARNLAANPDVVAVDIDNGAYKLSTGGAPTSYNGAGSLPQPNSVCFQDGYFFFTIGDSRCFASALNALTQNALTFITVQGRADVQLLRGIPFSNMLLLFTTGSFEAWQDQAIAAPAFPYGRLTIVDVGLVQPSAIAGFEVGFAELLWVSQDYHVQWMSPGSLAPNDVSPPDLNRLIERAVRAGQILEAGCTIAGGKKFWRISSPDWTWELNLSTKRWHERWSLNGGVYGRSRMVAGHPAFSKWIVGDVQSGNLLYPDNDSYTENGDPFLFRIESGPVREFPNATRIARADFDFVTGVGQEVGNYVMTVLGAASGAGGVVRLTVDQTSKADTGDQVNVAGVTGTTEANGPHPILVVDANHIELTDVLFQNAYVSGGTATDISSPPEAIDPQCAISCSKDGGISFDNPSLRSLAPQARGELARASVKNRGFAGPHGVRWRLDITDPVYRGLKGGIMSDNPQVVGP
ncbi:hypothetical protein [Bradyrhizobium betae]|uniref:Uncharacterized protein n=1 Tax=Bradyrhizobium betae TaxID=244734 RepID=A0A5P6NYK0_9BRAD|nr:hypothetical protein [Bradyrhizobium betae]MCS3725505.1 hypothetical protein [Bradyrhizobium betae]QFI71207.1 hypothetical protein F8237_01755 [Bradyrhizobium betae]